MVKQFIKRIITLNIIFALIMTIYRIIFTFYYSSWSNLSGYLSDLIQAFILGVRYDCAILAYINSLVTLSFIIFWFIGSQKIFIKFVKSLKELRICLHIRRNDLLLRICPNIFLISLILLIFLKPFQ